MPIRPAFALNWLRRILSLIAVPPTFSISTTLILVCLQHEYGIYGGPAGSHILALLRELRTPIVTTLHTILQEPSPTQRRVLQEVAALSDRVVVMSERGVEFLQDGLWRPAGEDRSHSPRHPRCLFC